jgi:oligosaccharide repeat unit polymerase
VSNFSAVDLKQNILMTTYGSNYFFESIGLQMFGYFSDTYFIAIIFFFIGLVRYPKERILLFILALSSLSTLANGYLVAGRVQMIYWILSFISIYLLFLTKMSKHVKKRAKRIMFVFISFFVSSLIIITIERFSSSYSNATNFDALFSVLEYGGQPLINFEYYMNTLYRENYNIGRIFPYIHDVFNEKFILVDYRNSLNIDIANFGTFLGDLFVDLGIFFGIFFVFWIISIKFLTHLLFLTKNYIVLPALIFLISMPIKGLFFYPYHTKTSINSWFFCIFLIFVIFIFHGKRHYSKL